jgi:hypothetical protein
MAKAFILPFVKFVRNLPNPPAEGAPAEGPQKALSLMFWGIGEKARRVKFQTISA